MNHNLICTWLDLPAGCWPPDHYRLLGLVPGEADVNLIEQRVHQRLDSVRRYQMMHPEQATEAMNRLAQAFVCLTEPTAKKTYDSTLPPPKVPPPVPPTRAPTPSAGSPARRAATPLGGSPVVPPPLPVPAPKLPEPIPATPPVDPLLEVMASARARRGLGTRRRTFDRRAQTHDVLRLWRKAGRFVEKPDERLSRPDAAEMLKLVGQIRDALEGFPPLLGEAGRPGYMLLTLTRMDNARDLMKLDGNQRQSLQRDWNLGLVFLKAHRDFLRRELRRLRRRPPEVRAARAVVAYVRARFAAAALVVLGLVALGIALYRTYG